MPLRLKRTKKTLPARARLARTTIHVDPAQLNPGQQALLASTDPQVLLSGGFGSGKTTAGAIKVLQLVTANRGVNGLVLAPNWRAMWSIVWKTLHDALAKAVGRENVPKIQSRQDECFVSFGGGSIVYLRSAGNVESFDGLDVGWVYGDELRHWTKKAYDVAIGRRRVRCPLQQSAFTSTPEFHWMAEEFNTGKPGRLLVRAPTAENAHNLAPDYIQNLRLSYSTRMQRAVIEGEFTILEGAVYEQFDPNERTSPWICDYNPHERAARKNILAIDPGFRRSAWVWFQERGPCDWVAVDQLMPENQSTASIVAQVNERTLNGKKLPIDEIWVDAAADSSEIATGFDVLDALGGIKTRPGTRAPIYSLAGPYRSIEYGVDKVRVLLGDAKNGDQPTRLKFSRHCAGLENGKSRGVVRDLAAYRYPDAKDGRPVTNVPLKDGTSDHSCDAVRYFAVGMFLTTPLRQLDPMLRKDTQAGYRRAA